MIMKYNNLPTADEYRKLVSFPTPIQEWSEPKYQCPYCGGGMCKNLLMILDSCPEQYKYRCNNCGHIEYQPG